MKTRRNAFVLMLILIKLIKSLWPTMFIAIFMGVIGFITAFGVTLSGIYAFLSVLPYTRDNLHLIFLGNFSTSTYIYTMIFCAIFRGILHYLEQYCNHYIAFKILANLRVKIFSILRNLAPAKMEKESEGNFIAMLTSDIELLEVFYAHTISPICIAFVTSIVLFFYFVKLNIVYAFYALVVQIFIGVVLPYFASSYSNNDAMKTRNNLGKLNDEFLDNLRGIREIIQYGQNHKSFLKIQNLTKEINSSQEKLKVKMNYLQSVIDSSIILFSILQIFISIYLAKNNIVSVEVCIIAAFLQLTSFAPYINLANLGNILSQTFACAERIQSLMEEKPSVTETENENISSTENANINIRNLSFGFDSEKKMILKNINLEIKNGDIIGIVGESGCGKSTLLKLLMRFWDPTQGEILLGNENIKNFKLDKLRENFNYMTQKTDLFVGNIRDNLLIAKEDASDEEIFAALKKASLYEHIMSLPDNLDSRIEEGGKNFSTGEKQRLGLARAFLANRPFFLLDEPTSNLDIQNEAIILKSLMEESKNRTIILVSHRESTLSICNKIFYLKDGNISVSQ